MTETTETAETTAPASADAPAVPSAGCTNSAQAAAALKQKETVKVDEKDRWWLMTTPGGDTPAALVVDFHGLLEGATIHAEMSKMAELGAKEKFAVATPDGWGSPIHWEVGTDPATNYDLKFVEAMLDQIEATHCIDTARVYATGLSNGAFMTSVMACAESDRFAAFAPVAGLTAPDGCNAQRPTPVMGFHGTNDQILKYNGGIGGIPGVSDNASDPLTAPVPEVDLDGEGYPANLASWAERNGCGEATDVTEKTGETTTPEVIHRVYDCPTGADTEFYSIVGGGHTWPGSEFSKAAGSVMGPTTMSFNASERIWEFFQQHALAS